MNAIIHYDDTVYCANEQESEDIINLIDCLCLDLDRIPNAGEWMVFYVGKYWVEAEVKNISTCYCEQGNPYIKERVWGITYNIFLDSVELMESYDN